TYEREQLLSTCLLSLLNQIGDVEYGILVVNNSPTFFSEKTRDFLDRIDRVRVIHEPNPGLSIARNAGIEASDANWIAFLDDDARVPIDFIASVFNSIDRHQFDCFGGDITSYWPCDRPRWLDESFGSKPPLSKMMKELHSEYNWGSNIIFRREALITVGGFPRGIGMKGQAVGYSAENRVQDALRAHAYRVGYDPNVSIEHAVLPHKHRLRWHFASAYATGRDGILTFPDQYGVRGLLRSLKKALSATFSVPFLAILRQDKCWERILLDMMSPWMLLAGKLKAVLLSNTQKE
ncbi:MAG: glycosyltransferase family 2 protein, partial [Bacteroidota bacterium]